MKITNTAVFIAACGVLTYTAFCYLALGRAPHYNVADALFGIFQVWLAAFLWGRA